MDHRSPCRGLLRRKENLTVTATEAVIVVVAIIAATVAAILNHLTPELGLLLGVAVGYGGKGAVTTALTIPKKTEVWKGGDGE